MKHGPLIFFGLVAAMAASFGGLVVAPQLQLGQLSPTNIINGTEIYPSARPGLAQQGAEVYRANGCFYCHTQQGRQSGTGYQVMLQPPPPPPPPPTNAPAPATPVAAPAASTAPPKVGGVYAEIASQKLAQADEMSGTTKSAMLLVAVENYAAGREFPQALDVAGKLEDYWKAVALGRVARQMTVSGEKEQAAQTARQAMSAASRVEGDSKFAAFGEIATDLAVAGDMKAALLAAEQVVPPEHARRRMAAALFAAGETNRAIATVMMQIDPRLTWWEAEKLLGRLPQAGLKTGVREEAEAAQKQLEAVGAKVAIEIVPLGPDIDRGWARRRAVPRDFIFDRTVMLGRLRTGPDLTSIGSRQEHEVWHLTHLYSPRSMVPDSTMPPYPFLFEVRERKPGQRRAEGTLPLIGEFAPKAKDGKLMDVVPKPEARALAAYLASLKSDASLPEQPALKPALADAGLGAVTPAEVSAAPGATKQDAPKQGGGKQGGKKKGKQPDLK